MKHCVVIYNPHSGTKEYNKDELKSKISNILKKYGYVAKFYQSKYKGAVTDIVQSLSSGVDLVISVGGDGTFNESMQGNFNRDSRLILGHLPTGTTNDIGRMYGYGKDLMKNLELLMDGEVKSVDICTINGAPFVYVAGFGKFMNIPYETTRKDKKRLGYIAYVKKGFETLFDRTKLYELSYDVDGETYHGFYSLMFVTNSTRIAGFQNIFNDIKLDDGKFEVLFCNIKNQKHMLKSLLYLATSDIEHVPGFYYHKTDKVVIHNTKGQKLVWDIDGEKMDIITEDIEIGTERTDLLVPKTNIKKLFK